MCFFLLFLVVFVSPLSWLPFGAWVWFLVLCWSCTTKILTSYSFLWQFWDLGTCWKGDLFLIFVGFFCKCYVLARTWLVFGWLKTKILISRCFWKHFGAVGTVFVRSFSWLHAGLQTWWLHFLMVFSRSLWGLAFGAWLHFLITQEENLDSVLFLFKHLWAMWFFGTGFFFLLSPFL